MSKKNKHIRNLNESALDGLRMRIMLSSFIPSDCAASHDGGLSFHGCFPYELVSFLRGDEKDEVLKNYIYCGRECEHCPEGHFKVFDRNSLLVLYKQCLNDDVEAKVLFSLYSKWLEKFLPLNQGLIMKASERLFKGHIKNGGFGIEDVIQEGYVGVLDAIDKFNPSKGSFSTVAWIWISHRVRRAGQSSIAVKIPKNKGYSVMSDISFHEYSELDSMMEENEIDMSPEHLLILEELINEKKGKG